MLSFRVYWIQELDGLQSVQSQSPDSDSGVHTVGHGEACCCELETAVLSDDACERICKILTAGDIFLTDPWC